MTTITIEIQSGVPPHLVVEIVARQLKEGSHAAIGTGYRWVLEKDKN